MCLFMACLWTPGSPRISLCSDVEALGFAASLLSLRKKGAILEQRLVSLSFSLGGWEAAVGWLTCLLLFACLSAPVK